MKPNSNKQTLGQSLLSLIIICTFILLAAGSYVLEKLDLNIKIEKEQTGTGNYKETEYHQNRDGYKTYEGKQDGHGRWHGQVKIEWVLDKPYTEVVTMEHGVRQGLSTRTYPDGHKEEDHYLNGIKYELKKAAHGKTDISAYLRLVDRYPWYLFSLNAWGFDNQYMEAFIDTIEIMLDAQQFETWEFDDYYDDVLSSLEETPFDSVIQFNSGLMFLQGLANMKNSELKLAVVDRYRSENTTIYDAISTTYPGYLVTLNDSGIINMDFEVFCQDLEDTLESYGNLDPEDPFYTDTVDTWLFNALIAIMDIEKSLNSLSRLSEKSTAGVKINDIHKMLKKFNILQKPFLLKSNPESTSSEVSVAVVSIMLMQFFDADIIRKVVRETYLNKLGIIGVPTAATVFIENSSSTSTILEGYILEDGGAEITTRGIAWSTTYNPRTIDNTEIPDTETNSFSITLNGLTTGTTYYARTFATNSEGTGYGNCVSFVASGPVAIKDVNKLSHDFSIYPNPSNTMTTFKFRLESIENITFSIINLNGQLIFNKDLGKLKRGENHVKIDLTDFSDGLYTCRLTNGKISTTNRFVVAH